MNCGCLGSPQALDEESAAAAECIVPASPRSKPQLQKPATRDRSSEDRRGGIQVAPDTGAGGDEGEGDEAGEDGMFTKASQRGPEGQGQAASKKKKKKGQSGASAAAAPRTAAEAATAAGGSGVTGQSRSMSNSMSSSMQGSPQRRQPGTGAPAGAGSPQASPIVKNRSLGTTLQRRA